MSATLDADAVPTVAELQAGLRVAGFGPTEAAELAHRTHDALAFADEVLADD
jgi:hypothetical protein